MENMSKEKLLNLKADDLNKYIKGLDEKLSLAKECLEYVKNPNISKEKRKNFLKEVPASKLIKIAPKSVLDPKDKKLGNHQKNTGVYLWKNGYEPEKLLGVGANGVVWKCNGNKAVKVTCNRTFGTFNMVNAIKDEIDDVKNLNNIIQKNQSTYQSRKNIEGVKKIDVEKYLAISQNKGSIDNKKHIFESELAKGDLSSKVKEIQAKRDINTIIKMGKQALKALKVLHDAGYSHNDVKPDNLLLIERDSKKIQGKKEAIQLADFGVMTKINNTHKIFVNSKFSPPDWYNTTPEAVAKRDVYAIGAVLLFLLIENKSISDSKKLAKELWSKGAQYIYNKYQLERKYCMKGSEKEQKNISKVMTLLNMIQLMVADSYKQRLTVDEALAGMLQISIN